MVLSSRATDRWLLIQVFDLLRIVRVLAFKIRIPSNWKISVP